MITSPKYKKRNNQKQKQRASALAPSPAVTSKWNENQLSYQSFIIKFITLLFAHCFALCIYYYRCLGSHSLPHIFVNVYILHVGPVGDVDDNRRRIINWLCGFLSTND